MYANLNIIKGGPESIISRQQENFPKDTSGIWRSTHTDTTRLSFRKPISQGIRIQFTDHVIPEISKKKKYHENFEDFLVERVLHNLGNVKNNFDDLRKRQILFNEIKEDIDNLWDFVSEDDYSKNLVILLVDCLENLKAETTTNNQIDTIEKVVEAISRGTITEKKLDFYIKFLIEKDIPLVRLPENFSNLYD